jgi:uncharacterized protein YcnI
MILLASGAAEAHIDVHPKSAIAGDFELLHFVVYHGCDQGPTTKVNLKIPEGVVLVRPQVKPGWKISTVTGKYAEPLQAGDQKISEGFIEVTWEGGNVPAFYTDDFTLLARMPLRPGEKAVFLAQQYCEGKTEPLEFAPAVALKEKQEEPVQPSATDPAPGSGQTTALALSGLSLLTGLIALVMATRRRR